MLRILLFVLLSSATLPLLAQNEAEPTSKRALKEAFDIGVRLGYASLPMEFSPVNSAEITTQQKGIPIFGIDVQYHLGFIDNLSIYSDPTYFNIQHVQNVQGLVLTELDISLSSISIPLGLRYHYELQEDFTLYANAAFEVLYDIDDTMFVSPPAQEVIIDSKNSWVAGVGIEAQRWVFDIHYRPRYSFFSRSFDVSTARFGIKVGYLVW